MTGPRRIQRRRTAGWRMPEGAIYVGRPSRWGNPFTIESALDAGWAEDQAGARKLAVECFEDVLHYGRAAYWWFAHGAEQIDWLREHVHELAGHDLACWCPLDQPCHADVLLEYANGGQP